MWSVSKNEKCCLSCANWGGSRCVKPGKRAETDSPSTRGKCYAGVTADATQGPTATGQRGCSKYSVWSALI